MDEWSPSHVSYLGLVPSRLGYCFRELWLDYSRQGRLGSADPSRRLGPDEQPRFGLVLQLLEFAGQGGAL